MLVDDPPAPPHSPAPPTDAPADGAFGRADRADAGFAAVLERLAAVGGEVPDRTAVRRAAGGAAEAVPGDAADSWAERLASAAAGIGLRPRELDLTPTAAAGLARDGAVLATRVPGGDAADGAADGAGGARETWWVLGPAKRGRVRVDAVPGGTSAGRTVRRKASVRRAAAAVDPGRGRPVLRWVANQGPHAPSERADGPHRSPSGWALALFRPEWGDVGVIAVFALFVGLLNLAVPIAVEALVSTVAFGRLLQPLIVLSGILLVCLLFGAVLRVLQTVVAEVIQRRLFVRVAADLAHRLPRVRAEAWDGHDGRELANRFFDVVTVQKSAGKLLLDGINLVLGAVVGLGVLAFYHPYLLGFDLVLIGTMVSVTLLLGRGAVRTAVMESKKKYRVAAWLEELAGTPRAFAGDGGPAFAAEQTDVLIADWLHARRAQFRVVLRQFAFAVGLQAAAATALLGIGGLLVIRGQLTLGQLVAAELIVTAVVGSFAKLGKYLETLYDLIAGADKLGHLFALPTEEAGGVSAPDVRAADRGASADLSGPVDFALAPGEAVGLCDPDGTRGRTVADLLAGRREVPGWTVRVDGLPADAWRGDALRRRVAVAAGGNLFAGTLAENVHVGRPAVTDRRVRDTLHAVGLADVADRLPDGPDTPLGPGGAPLTGTAADRLALARALAGDPGLVVLDGLLDCCTAGVADDLLAAARRGGRTVLLISRRSDLLESCDRVVAPCEE